MIYVNRRAFVLGAAAVGQVGSAQARSPRSSLPPALQAIGGTWRLDFQDDFKDPAVSRKKWTAVSDRGGGHDSIRIPENVSVSNEELRLKLGRSDGKRTWSAGYVQTSEYRPTYGYFETSMKIPTEKGVNNAFWLTSDPSQLNSDGTTYELDVVEAKFPNFFQCVVRRWKPSKITIPIKQRIDADLSEKHNIFAMLWLEDEISFFFNDKKIFATPNEFVHTPAVVKLSNAAGGSLGRTDDDVQGETSYEYVRVFRKM